MSVSDERNFQCSVCDKTYKLQAVLKQHERQQHGVGVPAPRRPRINNGKRTHSSTETQQHTDRQTLHIDTQTPNTDTLIQRTDTQTPHTDTLIQHTDTQTQMHTDIHVQTQHLDTHAQIQHLDTHAQTQRQITVYADTVAKHVQKHSDFPMPASERALNQDNAIQTITQPQELINANVMSSSSSMLLQPQTIHSAIPFSTQLLSQPLTQNNAMLSRPQTQNNAMLARALNEMMFTSHEPADLMNMYLERSEGQHSLQASAAVNRLPLSSVVMASQLSLGTPSTCTQFFPPQ